MDLGHWNSLIEDFNPGEWFGFVYRITNNTTDMSYIGRKQFFSQARSWGYGVNKNEFSSQGLASQKASCRVSL